MASVVPPVPTVEAPAAAPPRGFAIALGLFAASAALCLLGYLVVAIPGPWFSNAPTLQWTHRDFRAPRGSTQLFNDALSVYAPDATGIALVTIDTSFASADYPVVAWDVAYVPEQLSATLLWRNDYQPGRLFSRALTVEAGRVLPARLSGDPNWVGKISGLALALRGTFHQAIVVRGAAAKPMTAGEVLRDRVGEWFAFEPWSGASINSTVGGADVQDFPLPVFLAAIVAFSALVYAALARRRPAWVGPFRPVLVVGLFVAAWILLDMRWQWNLIRQARATYVQYAGKSWQERHLAAEDGMLFAFIEKVRAKLPPPPVRVFVASSVHYFRDRAAWHLYPYNVFFDPTQDTIPPSSMMRSGDYLVVFQRRGVQYDAALQNLRWDGGEPVLADLLLVDDGSALFRIR